MQPQLVCTVGAMTTGQAAQDGLGNDDLGTDDLGIPQELRIENQLCFALYAATRAVTELYRPLLNDFGVTYPQYLVLLVLWERDTRPVKDLTAALQLDYGTVSPLLKRLEAQGLVTRHRASDNESRVLVSLTEAGSALRTRAAGIPRALSCALDRPDEGANRELLETLRELTTAAQTADPLSPDEGANTERSHREERARDDGRG